MKYSFAEGCNTRSTGNFSVNAYDGPGIAAKEIDAARPRQPQQSIITCAYCGHRYHADTAPLYCTQCRALLETE